MIISHKHKFIFIKTEKTAGTSIEIALSKHCGPIDIITPITAEDEIKRKELGYRGPQNYYIPLSKYSKEDLIRAVCLRMPPTFFNHASAKYILDHIGEEVWTSYFKFCFERNPWDKVVSSYYWRYRTDPRPTISEFVQSQEANTIQGFQLYTINSEVVVNKVFFFERLKEAMEEICDRVGLPEVPVLANAKTGYRKDKRSYREILSEKDKEKIQKVYAREIAYFNYSW